MQALEEYFENEHAELAINNYKKQGLGLMHMPKIDPAKVFKADIEQVNLCAMIKE